MLDFVAVLYGKTGRSMRPSQALQIHRVALREIAARHRVTNVRVFGSVLHKSDTEASDLDLLVDATPGTTLMDLAALQVEAEALLGLPVDVLTAPFLPSSFRERVMSEAEPL
jgi:predicted nucleotidyltransferase